MSAIYALGSNGSGQLGIGHKEDVSVPKGALFPDSAPQPVVIKAGGNHTLILSSTGTVLCAGDYGEGACGLVPDELEEFTFMPLKSGLQNDVFVTHIAAMWEASVIVTKDEAGRSTRIYSFGTGHKGELGLGDLIFRTSKAQLIETFPPAGTQVVDIAASVSHVVVVLCNGDVYGWGNGRKGQLGLPADIVRYPRKIEGLEFKAAKVACAREATFLVGAAGNSGHIVLGSDKYRPNLSISEQRMQSCRSIGASWSGIFCLLLDGSIMCWGRNDHGQLPPTGLPKLVSMAVGSEHVLGLTETGDVIAWGWGEHGNCGPGTDANGDVKDKWNVVASSKFLPPGGKIASIGAGCATSWISITA